MKIAIVSQNVIPALMYGGTERVIWYLGKELSKMGHKVYFLVKKGSYCDFAQVIVINPEKPIWKQIPEDTDIVHFNSNMPEEEEYNTKPYILTIHGNTKIGETTSINTVFVSANHAKRFGSNSFVYNGIDWDNYGMVNLKRSRTFYHFLGKAAWKVKNVKGAISIAKALPEKQLMVLGGYRFNFKMGIRFTFSPQIHFKGIVDDIKKKKILECSKGLLFPVIWHEPFGLAIIESLYFGTPVFGTPYGSLPEIVSKEVGFLSNNKSEIVNHIMEEGEKYSPLICHEYACDKFNSKVMAEAYLKKYEIVMNNQTLNSFLSKALKSYRNLSWIE
ncbi:hypothetical protein EZS27_016397 [termite gut metagenome]|uniref:Glycosyl transferase family 1 domain-containing protein n=1 Tax=termite gut metagenome TaxID=433724 RepID=A0A5J4RNX7_9ZZZZ